MVFGYKELKILWIFLGVSPISQNWASFRVISMHFRFFMVKVQNWNIFGVLDIPDILWGERLMLGPSLHMRKTLEYPPPPPPLGVRQREQASLARFPLS